MRNINIVSKDIQDFKILIEIDALLWARICGGVEALSRELLVCHALSARDHEGK